MRCHYAHGVSIGPLQSLHTFVKTRGTLSGSLLIVAATSQYKSEISQQRLEEVFFAQMHTVMTYTN